MISVCRISLTVCCLLVCARELSSAPPERSISSSRQFLIFGADVRLRGAICDLAERTKEDVLKLIDRRDEWTTPIVVNARYRQANLPETPAAALSFAQTGFGLKLQLDLRIASDVSQPEVRRELLRSILLEMMYRAETNLPAGTAYVSPPDWLLYGIPSRQSEFDRERLVEILAVSATTPTIPSLQEFLRPEGISRLDGPGRLLYAGYSFALVDFLSHTPDGPGRLARFIANIYSASRDPMASLRTHFPELKDPKKAETAWSSRIAQLAARQPFHLLGLEETERKLAESLALKISKASPGKFCLDEFPKFIRDAASKLALSQCSRDLTVLATRAHPLYRSMIHEYGRIAALLVRGKTKGTAERLARLKASRKVLMTTMREIDDYLNWFEATQSSAPSRAFGDYLRAADEAPRPAQKRDPISVYLDVLELQFQN